MVRSCGRARRTVISTFVFPKWTNGLKHVVGAATIVVSLYLVALVNYGFSPRATDVGYQPEQPVPYSHALHAGRLGLDCRYCHVTVENAAHAAIPPTQTCMNCHSALKTDSLKLDKIRESHKSGLPVEWVRVHDLSDFAYFNHSAHVRRGIGCASCHGRIDRMEVVHQDQPLNMAWCLDCHRDPDKYLRPPDLVTKMDFDPVADLGKTQAQLAAELRAKYAINPSTDCSTCHR